MTDATPLPGDPDELRQRYVEALAQPLPCLKCGRTNPCRCIRPKTPTPAERRADLLLAIRDELLERARAGESDHPAAEGTHHTPAQWIHRWNRATADERLAKVEQIFNDSVTATRCWYQDHDAALHELANTRQTINRVREFADQIAKGSRTVSREFVAQGLLKIMNGETT